ncbi:MAG TPA: hypothetical protein VNU66_04340 [Mycobacteriales bacterium]|nr:hypothetical protein [Mycobacteriales bacterium]
MQVRPALVGAGLVVLLAGCSTEQGAYPHPGQSGGWTEGSVARTVLLYVLLPLALLVAVSVLAAVPQLRRRSRYRPQEGWSAAPVWFAGPADPATAVEQAEAGDVVRGGAGGSW